MPMVRTQVFPACFKGWGRSLEKLRQRKASFPGCSAIVPAWYPSFPTSVLSERSGQLRRTPGDTLPTHVIAGVSSQSP